MRKHILLSVLLFPVLAFSAPKLDIEPDTLQFGFSRHDVNRAKVEIAGKNQLFLPAAKKLQENARKALDKGPWTVVDKKQTPPSGNKHDYMSYAKYWWPDPHNPEGSYIRRDGETNPYTKTSDKEDLGDLTDTVEILALAGYLFENEKYAKRAVSLIKAWFLDPETFMSPHLKYAQAIPNLNEGRSYGIIETRKLVRILDAVQLLRAMELFSDEDYLGMKSWISQYLDWLLTSEFGKKEGSNGNNHETAWTLQVSAFAIFTGRYDVALGQFNDHFKGSILDMIDKDGGQPRELARTKALHYSMMNLGLMLQIVELARKLDIDLLSFERSDGRSIMRAFEFLYPYVALGKTWPYPQIEKSDPDYDQVFYIFRILNKRLGRPDFETIIEKYYGSEYMEHPGQLYWPVFGS